MILNLDNNDINVIVQSLEQGPFRMVAPTLMKIQAQIVAQQNPAPAPAPVDGGAAVGGTD